MQTCREFTFKAAGKFLGLAPLFALALVSAPAASAQVLTVPWVPGTTSPHTAVAGTPIILGAIFNAPNSTDSYTFSWNFGDGSAATTPAAVTLTNGIGEDISTTHTYPSAGSVVGITTWNAVVTVTDINTSAQSHGTYPVIWEDGTVLQSRVNVAIDKGLWYLHQVMARPSATTGNWEGCAPGYSGYACSGYGSLTATNVQAFEVDGHLATGPASDPYTNDVAEGLASLEAHFVVVADGSSVTKTYTYNPAVNNFGCSDGTAPVIAATPTCGGTATVVYYNSTAGSCTTPGSPTPGNCTFHFDGNGNSKMAYVNGSGDPGYEMGMYVDALVASGTGTVASGALSGESYKDVVQDLADYSEYCQYTADYDVLNGYTRGSNNSQGGGWWYGCPNNGSYGDDNSTSQWQSIGLIAASRGFGLSLPTVIPDANSMWITASQDVQSSAPTKGSWAAQYAGTGEPYGNGGFGYNGSLYYSNAWGPFAVTPSGMVQMSLDGIGRAANTDFNPYSPGEYSTTAPDQRFNNAETFYADNFCNAVNTYGNFYNPENAPRSYMYGMFSFTKSMLLHNPNGPGGALKTITYLRTQTPGVFTSTNPNTPANTIDWYGAVGPEDGGTDSCDGIAQTLLDRQQSSGLWNSYFDYQVDYSSAQYPYETAWALIMLQRTVFVQCVNNLNGQGFSGSSLTPARVDLSWTGISSATGYNILASPTSGGPYTQVTFDGGTTTQSSFSDRSNLTNGQTYYFVLQPVNGSSAVCTSNQVAITVPNPSSRR